MKCFVILSFCVVAILQMYSKIQLEVTMTVTDTYFYFVGDDDGIVHLVDTLQPINQALLRQLLRNSVNLYFVYKFGNPTIFLVHGWGAKGDSEINEVLIDAFLKDGDVNAIVLEWSAVANPGYMTAQAGVPQVGKGLGEFIKGLTTLGVSYDKVHLVGYSLGIVISLVVLEGKVARIAVCSARNINNSVKGYEDGDRYFYFSDSVDKMYIVDALEPANNNPARNASSNIYLLFTRNNPSTSQTLIFHNPDSIYRSNFDFGKQTVFLAHGWKGDASSPFNRVMTEAFLETADLNIIVLDWNFLAEQSYVNAKRDTPVAGRGLGEFINWLAALGASYNNMHLLGFSLGAHLVGCAGRETDGRVARITALDPAGPLWYFDNNRVKPTDGVYVEVIHSNTALLGISSPSGDADFYPNGGVSMPGCYSNICSHQRAYQYTAATLKYNHLRANSCDSYLDVLLDRCTGPLEPMGNGDLIKTSVGIFRVNTAEEYPF